MLGSEWGSWLEEVNHGWASRGERAALCIPLFCIFFVAVSLLLPFASFAVLLNCPHPDPWVLPFSSHSPPHLRRGERWQSNRMVLCCQPGLKHNSVSNVASHNQHHQFPLCVPLQIKTFLQITPTKPQNTDLARWLHFCQRCFWYCDLNSP